MTPRAERRARARADEKLAHARERLALLEDGGTPERPIEVISASVVEPHAQSMPCLRCHGACRVDEHVAETVSGKRLRIARTLCMQCGARRNVFFRITGNLVN